MAQRHEYQFAEQRTTLWKNNTKLVQRVELFTTHMEDVPGRTRPDGTQTTPHKRAVKLERTWQPNDTIELPIEFDEALQKVLSGEFDKELRRTVGGIIHGGAAPQLTNMSIPADKRPKLHQSLDGALQATLHANAMAAAAAMNAQTANDLAILATHRVRQEEERKRELEAAAELEAATAPAPKHDDQKNKR